MSHIGARTALAAPRWERVEIAEPTLITLQLNSDVPSYDLIRAPHKERAMEMLLEQALKEMPDGEGVYVLRLQDILPHHIQSRQVQSIWRGSATLRDLEGKRIPSSTLKNMSRRYGEHLEEKLIEMVRAIQAERPNIQLSIEGYYPMGEEDGRVRGGSTECFTDLCLELDFLYISPDEILARSTNGDEDGGAEGAGEGDGGNAGGPSPIDLGGSGGVEEPVEEPGVGGEDEDIRPAEPSVLEEIGIEPWAYPALGESNMPEVRFWSWNCGDTNHAGWSHPYWIPMVRIWIDAPNHYQSRPPGTQDPRFERPYTSDQVADLTVRWFTWLEENHPEKPIGFFFQHWGGPPENASQSVSLGLHELDAVQGGDGIQEEDRVWSIFMANGRELNRQWTMSYLQNLDSRLRESGFTGTVDRLVFDVETKPATWNAIRPGAMKGWLDKAKLDTRRLSEDIFDGKTLQEILDDPTRPPYDLTKHSRSLENMNFTRWFGDVINAAYDYTLDIALYTPMKAYFGDSLMASNYSVARTEGSVSIFNREIETVENLEYDLRADLHDIVLYMTQNDSSPDHYWFSPDDGLTMPNRQLVWSVWEVSSDREFYVEWSKARIDAALVSIPADELTIWIPDPGTVLGNQYGAFTHETEDVQQIVEYAIEQGVRDFIWWGHDSRNFDSVFEQQVVVMDAARDLLE